MARDAAARVIHVPNSAALPLDHCDVRQGALTRFNRPEESGVCSQRSASHGP